MDRVRLEQERGDDAEVAASTTQRPQKVLVVPLVGSHKSAIGQHDVGGEQVVDGQAVFAGQVSQPAAQGKPASAAPDGNEEVVLTTEVDRRDDIGHVGTTGDQGRALVDHTVVDFA